MVQYIFDEFFFHKVILITIVSVLSIFFVY